METFNPEKSKPEIYFPEVRAIIESEKFLRDGQKALASMDDKKDALRHSQRITNMGYLLHKHLGITSVDEKQFVEICLLHDIGKKDIPPKHLTRQFDKFSPKDMEAVRKHVRTGYMELKQAGRSPRVYNAVLLHHQFQAKSYPKIGAEFREIEPADVDNARLLAILDVFDTCAFGRSYVGIEALPIDEAKKKLMSLFDQPGDEAVINFLASQYETVKKLFI